MVTQQNLSNFHYAYAHLVRHWHAGSEQFTGGDALFTALDNGWEVDETVLYEEHWIAGAQCVVVFRFRLTHGDESMTMPVITNPFVQRILAEMNVKLIPARERKQVKTVKQG
jgi:hypothetical protein